ncbi:hypothetical protein BDZ94DRAFT_1268038 [Collybia nuda]|uniref:Uncharacterized protein n=1 Tax=Collybia nuda TaxID=64659 RepID=A0A9P5XXL8_9AGAR|nr:hypothetical protein BDZ94DRAFT_1268038 [Collybia nuda]
MLTIAARLYISSLHRDRIGCQVCAPHAFSTFRNKYDRLGIAGERAHGMCSINTYPILAWLCTLRARSAPIGTAIPRYVVVGALHR